MTSTPTPTTTTLRLNRPFEADGRWVDAIVFSGEPGGMTLPVFADGDGAEMDCRAFAYAMARATGLSMAAITGMDPLDRLALALLLFAPVSRPAKRSRHGH